MQAVVTGRSDVASGTVALWLAGEGAMLAYVLSTPPLRSPPLVVNYAANLALVGVIAWYRWR